MDMELQKCVELIAKSDPWEAVAYVIVAVLAVVFAFAKKSLPQFIIELPAILSGAVKVIRKKDLKNPKATVVEVTEQVIVKDEGKTDGNK
jgi:hypothetical protein